MGCGQAGRGGIRDCLKGTWKENYMAKLTVKSRVQQGGGSGRARQKNVDRAAMVEAMAGERVGAVTGTFSVPINDNSSFGGFQADHCRRTSAVIQTQRTRPCLRRTP